MLNFSPEKLFLVGVIALIVLGPHRLPQAARTLGRFVAQVRRMSSSFQEEVREALADPTDAVKSAAGEFRIPDVRRSMREAVTSTFTAPVTAVPPSSTNTAGEPDAPSLGVGDAATGALVPPAPDDPSLN
ncbi:MAG TPA: twin-arginine translocase TatA/TatE family subunit [Acidimicrobiales bacterium]|nr:twin-arginine translocase TatA/TatE family subunit [Acidimicrobiales bacterium]